MLNEEEISVWNATVNRRTTWLILGFAFFSLLASVVPLIPGIGKVFPVDLVDRRGALTLYAAYLLIFMALIFPVSLLGKNPQRDEEQERGDELVWWWVGAFMLAFSGVPLFVLSYIAGVSLKGVFTVLLWAGVFHGITILWRRLLGHRARIFLIVMNFLLIAVMPMIKKFKGLMNQGATWEDPMSLVVGVTRDFAAPQLILPGTLMALIYLAIFALCRRTTSKTLVATATVLLVSVLCGFAEGPVERGTLAQGRSSQKSGIAAASLTNNYFVSGRSFPLKITSPVGQEVRVKVDGQDEISWKPEPGEEPYLWVYLNLVTASEVLVEDGQGQTVARFKPLALSPPKKLVLFYEMPVLPLSENLVAVETKNEPAFDSPLAYDAFSSVVMTKARYQNRLSSRQKAALQAWVRGGGQLVMEDDPSLRPAMSPSPKPPFYLKDNLACLDSAPSRQRAVVAANLYSNFALPDWGNVDLNGLILFLGIYHVVFYVIFLLPLIFDSKKSQTVYLISVGFVLALVVVGAYFTLKNRFLTENQVLQQNFCVWRLPSTNDELPNLPGAQVASEGWIELSQYSCFASFNGNSEELTFDLANQPQLAHASTTPPEVKMSITDGGRKLSMAGLELDRFLGKQVVKLSQREPSPFHVQRQGQKILLQPKAQVFDEFGLLSANKVSAFYRSDGRLFPAQIKDGYVQIGEDPDSLVWQGVIPPALRSKNVVPFLRYCLGRHSSPQENLLVILLEGARSLHGGDHYLARKDILQVLLLEVD